MTTLCELWAQSATQFAPRVAVHDRGADWTWRELDDQARRLAGALLDRGFRAGDRLALLVPNSREYIVGYFAALLAGGVAVGLHPDALPREHLLLLRHCDARAVLATNRVWERFDEVAGAVPQIEICIGPETDSPRLRSRLSFDALCESRTVSRTLPSVSESQPAQIIYTSGTTGRPKGVFLSHSGLCANTRSIVESLQLTCRDSVFVALPFCYSYGNSLLLTHVAVGGRMILAGDFVFWNRALDLMVAQRATGFSAVPSAYSMLLARSDFERRPFPDLRYLTCAGGALAPALVSRVRAAVPGARYFSMYGQTEAAARLSILPPEEIDRRPGSIGKGIPGVELRVVDDQGRPTALGVVGEIVARGENLMLGYWNDPELTSRVLRDGWLHTGDLGRIDEEEFIYIVGRRSDMIKSGAYRIAPLELEEVLLELPGVAEAAVVGRIDDLLGEVPIAFVVRNPQHPELTESHVLDYCRRNLPRYKLIRSVQFVDELPKTPAGKVRRETLTSLANKPASCGD